MSSCGCRKLPSGVASDDRLSGLLDGVEPLFISERPVAVDEAGPEHDSGDHAEELRRRYVEVVHVRGSLSVGRLEVAPERPEYGQRAKIEGPLAQLWEPRGFGDHSPDQIRHSG